MANPRAAQVARNTTAYPRTSPGAGPTYTPIAPATTAPVYTTPAALQAAQEQEASPSPVANALAAAPDTTSAPSSNPFDTDWGYLQALADQQASSQRLDDALRAAREAAIVQFGDPSLAIPGFNVDPLTAAAAQANTAAGNSTLAQLQRTRDQNQRTIINNLAAHGLIRSGDLGYQTGQNQIGYGNSLYNAQQQVLSALAGDAQDTQDKKDNLQSGVTSALTKAYDNYIANPGLWGAATGGTAAAQNAAATESAPAPIASALTTRPTSRLARPVAGYGGGRTSYQVGRNSF